MGVEGLLRGCATSIHSGGARRNRDLVFGRTKDSDHHNQTCREAAAEQLGSGEDERRGTSISN